MKQTIFFFHPEGQKSLWGFWKFLWCLKHFWIRVCSVKIVAFCLFSFIGLFSLLFPSQVRTSTRRPRLTSRPNSRTWTRRRTPRKSTPTSPAPPTPRTCSLCLTPSPTSSSRTTWRTVASSNNTSEKVKVRSEEILWQGFSSLPSHKMDLVLKWLTCLCLFCVSLDYLNSSNNHDGGTHTSWMTALANHDSCFDLLFIKTPKRLITRRASQNFNSCWFSPSYR